MIRRRRRIAARGVRGSTRTDRRRKGAGAALGREPAVDDVDVGVVVCVYALEVGPRLGVGARDVVGARAIVEPGADIRRAPAGSLSGVRGQRAVRVARGTRETGAHSDENREEETARAAGHIEPAWRAWRRSGRKRRARGGEGRGRRARRSAPPRRRPLGAPTRRVTSERPGHKHPKIARDVRGVSRAIVQLRGKNGMEALALRDAPATVSGTRVVESSLLRDGRPRRRRATGIGRALVPSFDRAVEPSFRE